MRSKRDDVVKYLSVEEMLVKNHNEQLAAGARAPLIPAPWTAAPVEVPSTPCKPPLCGRPCRQPGRARSFVVRTLYSAASDPTVILSSRFMCSQLPNQVLKSISIIDSPGILSGEKQRISRGQCSPASPSPRAGQASLRWQQTSVPVMFSPCSRTPPAPLGSPRVRG